MEQTQVAAEFSIEAPKIGGMEEVLIAMANLPLPEALSCPFCEYLQGVSDAVFVSRGKTASVLVNPRQYEHGALLVVPNAHASTLIDAGPESFVAVQLEARRMAHLLVQELGATGINVFQNAGVAAGQTVPHYHVHVVPRYSSSDPGRRFREADYEVAPIDQLEAVAEALRNPAGASSAGHSGALYDMGPKDGRLWGVLFAGWMLVAFASLARLMTAPETAFGVPRTALFSLQLAALLVATLALKAQRKRTLMTGFGVSIALFAASVLLTF